MKNNISDFEEIANENLEKSIADFTEALKRDLDFADVYYNRGFVYYRKGDYNSAIADFTTAIDVNPDFAEVV